MSKKVLILSGSPRKGGNSDILCEQFRKGAEEAGNVVEKVDLRSLKIGYCMACYGCRGKGVCVQKDDMAQIYPAVRESDVVVLASPLYYWTLSGQLRAAFDRLFALEEGDGNLLRGHGRGGALLMAAEGSGFGDVLTYFDHLMEHLRWDNLGHVLAGGNGDIGDIQGKPELQQAFQLGASLR